MNGKASMVATLDGSLISIGSSDQKERSHGTMKMLCQEVVGRREGGKSFSCPLEKKLENKKGVEARFSCRGFSHGAKQMSVSCAILQHLIEMTDTDYLHYNIEVQLLAGKVWQVG